MGIKGKQGVGIEAKEGRGVRGRTGGREGKGGYSRTRLGEERRKKTRKTRGKAEGGKGEELALVDLPGSASKGGRSRRRCKGKREEEGVGWRRKGKPSFSVWQGGGGVEAEP